jgi:predicted phage terminase large subunit-like protein
LIRKLLIRDAIRTRRARADFASFVCYTKPDFRMGWFHAELARLLEQFLEDVIQKRAPRLMLFAPPQHGKSELVSRRFPAYALGRHLHLRVIATSYGASLAFDLSSDEQRIMDSDSYHRLFPGTVIPGQFGVRGSVTRKLDNFGIVGHSGSYRAAGVDGAVTGKSAEILIVDDPFKNYLDAHSFTTRDNIWKNFSTALRTRVQDGGGILIVSTRWHLDDLCGRLLEREPERWTVVSFPAIATEDEEHRKRGEPLSEERYSLDALDEQRGAMDEYLWNALYQQNPTPEGGGMLKRHKWRYWCHPGQQLPPVTVLNERGEVIEVAAEELPASFSRRIQSWDLAFEGKQTSDFVAGLDIGVSGAKRYIIDSVHERMDFTETIQAIERFRAMHPDVSGIFVENKANGAAAIATLSQRVAGINAVDATKSKYDRAYAASDELNARNWFLPHPQIAPWVNEFLFELSSFPRGKFDDWVDAWSQAAGELNTGVDYSMFNERVNVFSGLNPSYFRKSWEW